jgi:hypothetical protein
MSDRGEVTVHIDAPPEVVYALVSDVTRMGEWSPETYRAEWIEGATGPEVGARFKGYNRAGPMKWSTTPTVIAADPGREFAFATSFGKREATRWRYAFRSAEGGGTDVTESWEEVWSPLPFRLAGKLINRHQKLNDGMRLTLERIKDTAERV